MKIKRLQPKYRSEVVSINVSKKEEELRIETRELQQDGRERTEMRQLPRHRMNIHLLHLECVELLLDSLRKRWRQSIARSGFRSTIVNRCRPRCVHREVLRKYDMSSHASDIVAAARGGRLRIVEVGLKSWSGGVVRRIRVNATSICSEVDALSHICASIC